MRSWDPAKTIILLIGLVLIACGLVMVYNTSSAEILDRGLSQAWHRGLVRQVVYACIGGGCSYFVWRIGPHHLIQMSPYLLFFVTLFLILVFVPKIGLVRNGSHRWIGIGQFTFQPSEWVKFLIPFTFIYLLQRQQESLSFLRFMKWMGWLAIPLLLVFKEPDNGTAAIIILGLLPLFFLGKVPFQYWALPLVFLVIIGAGIAYQLPYVRARIEVYLHPESDLKGKGHQAYQAKIAAGSGGYCGKGAGQSLQKLTYLPEAQNDYIAAIFAEEFGFIGISFLLCLYVGFLLAGIAIGYQATHIEGYYLAAIITWIISIQAFLNFGVVSGLLPSKGVNLPFISGGGTSLLTNMMATALLMSIPTRSEKNDREMLHAHRM